MKIISEIVAKFRKYSPINFFTYTGVRRRRILRQLGLLLWYLMTGRRFVTASVNNYEMILDLWTPGISKALFVYGKRELLDTGVVSERVSGNMTVLEVGANIGYYALLEALRLGEGGKIYAFEPDPRNVEVLKKNIVLNRCESVLSIFPQAVSDVHEFKKFNLGERSNISSFVDRSDNVAAIDVECVKIDDLPFKDEIDFVRMDVEGYEVKVIEGMKSLIEKQDRPLQIFLEVHPSAYDEELDFNKTLKWLFGNGFDSSILISSQKHEQVFNEKGYRSKKQAIEMKYARSLYEDISQEDTLYFLKRGVIRSLLLERK